MYNKKKKANWIFVRILVYSTFSRLFKGLLGTNSAGLLKKTSGFVRFAMCPKSAVLLKKTSSFVGFGHICVQMVLDY